MSSRVFTACIDERPWLPHTNPDPGHPGNMQILIKSVAHDLGSTVQIISLPWRRCLESVRTGKIDAMVGAGDVPFTRELGEFPKIGNIVDSGRSLGMARVMLVKRAGSKVSWNGVHFSGLSKPVGVAKGTQVMITSVQNSGGTVDDGGKTDLHNIRKLLEYRVDLMAGYDFDLKKILAQGYHDRLVMLAMPLVESNYYLAFSKAFYTRNKVFAENFWNRVGFVKNKLYARPSAKYRYNIETSSANILR